MQLTRITNANEHTFSPFLTKSASAAAPDLIRLGVLDDEDRAVGAMSARTGNGIADITSLYVVQDERRHGFGKALIDRLEDILSGEQFDTVGAAFLESGDADSFYKAMGFELFSNSEQYYFTLGELVRSYLYQKFMKDKKYRSVSEISSMAFKDRKVVDNVTGFKDYDPEWSTAVVDNGQYHSSLLAEHDEHSVSILWLETKNYDPTIILKHLGALAKKTAAEYADSVNVRFRVVFHDTGLAEKLETLLGGHGHLHSEGRLINAIKVF